MSGPPDDVSPRALWQKLQESPRPNVLIDFPRKDFAGNSIGQLRIQVLTVDERIDCAAAAEVVAKTKLKDGKSTDIGYDEVYREEVCVQILWRACRDAADPTRAAWPTPALLRTITTEENAVLFEHYMTTQRKFGPIVAELSAGELEDWTKRLAQGGAEFPLDLLSSDMKDVLLLHLAFRLNEFLSGSSSAGLPLESTSTESSPSDRPDVDSAELTE